MCPYPSVVQLLTCSLLNVFYTWRLTRRFIAKLNMYMPFLEAYTTNQHNIFKFKMFINEMLHQQYMFLRFLQIMSKSVSGFVCVSTHFTNKCDIPIWLLRLNVHFEWVFYVGFFSTVLASPSWVQFDHHWEYRFSQSLGSINFEVDILLMCWDTAMGRTFYFTHITVLLQSFVYTFVMSSYSVFMCEHSITFMAFISYSFVVYLDMIIKTCFAVALFLTNRAVKSYPLMLHQYMII